MKIRTILDQIDLGSMALPKFQRGYVWNRDQVKGLMWSLYRKYPVGSLLVWETKTEYADARGEGSLQSGTVKLLLDGQQRISSLYGIIRGKPPQFFDGNAQAFKGLYFHLATETFEFFAPIKMKDDPLWINVTEFMQKGQGDSIKALLNVAQFQENMSDYVNHFSALDAIKDIDLHIEQVSGEDKTVDVVVEIFNRVNSGGTKLSKGDLALAKICAEWPQAREELQRCLKKWHRAGFKFTLDWLLRGLNAISTGEALFSALKDVQTAEVKVGLKTTEKIIDNLLNLIAARLGLDHDRVLGGRGAFPLMARYLAQRGGNLTDHAERDCLLYWYVHTLLWGRYSGSTESTLNRDLAAIEGETDLTRLLENLRVDRGDLTVRAEDFGGWNRGSRFYPALYMLSRVGHARDWGTGVELSDHMLGYMNQLELHHIFPKSLLYKFGYQRAEVNALANFTFLTKETNLKVSNRRPDEYLPEYAASQPGVLESHWIPMDPELWKLENFPQFLAERRRLLAAATNAFLNSLLNGPNAAFDMTTDITDRVTQTVSGSVETEEEERLLLDINLWVAEFGLPEGSLMYEVQDPDTAAPIAQFDLAWPYGLQEGYSQPVALLINETQDTLNMANQAGFRYFTNADDFKAYVQKEILALAP
jgi:hypothetical protein